jgi:hypothetical protein
MRVGIVYSRALCSPRGAGPARSDDLLRFRWFHASNSNPARRGERTPGTFFGPKIVHSFLVEMSVPCTLIARAGNASQLSHKLQRYTIEDTDCPQHTCSDLEKRKMEITAEN